MTDNGENRAATAELGGQRQTLYESSRTRVTRWFPADGRDSLICKEPLGPAAQNRLRHERSLLQRLAGVGGVPQLIPVQEPGRLLTTDANSPPLTSAVTPMDPGELIEFAVDLAGVLSALHRAGIVHRDVNPANILLSRTRPRAHLIDFELATTITGDLPSPAPQREIEGTLAYLAPEQTGRTGRAADQRADLYAMGSTLYELTTGEPPFGTGDPLRLTHDHLTRLPTPPHELNDAIPVMLSRVILRLLEKEPDRRYQSAEGLRYDLRRILSEEPGSTFPLGDRDDPPRPRVPSHLTDRDHERDQLVAALDRAVKGHSNGLLISGVSGVGKSALSDELRPMASAAGGWFVHGKFDRYRRDQDYDGLSQAFRALGQLLLAEPETALVPLRARLRADIGNRIPLLASVLPEFAVLMGDPGDPEPGDPLLMQTRLQQLGPDLLRVIAASHRPLVIVVDDLQWAGATSLGAIDAMWTDENLDGVLLVGVYRTEGVDAAGPLAPMLSRWHQAVAPPDQLVIANLGRAGVRALVGDMLRVDGADADELAAAVEERTGGNPFETVELVNALVRARPTGLSEPDRPDSVRRLREYVAEAEASDVLVERIDRMPIATRATLAAMACLGGQVELALLRAAVDPTTVDVADLLGPAVGDGLVLESPGEDAVRFRHDRVQDAVLDRLGPDRVGALRLELGRRLSREPTLRIEGAAQYLGVADVIHEPEERQFVAQLFIDAAAQARTVSGHALVERYLSASLALADPPDNDVLVGIESERQAALYSLGRLDEADQAFDAVKLASEPLVRTDATCVQISSLLNRGRPGDALALGLELLQQLGLSAPPSTADGQLDEGIAGLYRWVADSRDLDDLQRPETTDPTVVAMARLISRVMPAAFLTQPQVMVWLVVQAARLWERHGPTAPLVGAVANIAFVMTALNEDYEIGHRAISRVLAAGEARGYEPDTSQARMLYTLGTGHWFDPLERNVVEARRAREGLVQGGDLSNACFTFVVTVQQFLECAPNLDVYLAEVHPALAFAARTGNDQLADMFHAYNGLLRTLRSEPGAQEAFDSFVPNSDDPVTILNLHVTQAQHAAMNGDHAELAHHAAALMRGIRFAPANYLCALGHLLWALSLAGQAREATATERPALLDQLDASRQWLAQRSEDAPENFSHLVLLVEAERAWAVGDHSKAATAFDRALLELTTRQRPWHRALVTERAARFNQARGLGYTASGLLREARQVYEAWGATEQVRRLDEQFPALRPDLDAASADLRRAGRAPSHTASITTGAIDLLAILEAARALSSETNLDRLRVRVTETLSAMTGATTVHVLLWNDEDQRWYLPASGRGLGPAGSPIDAGDGLLPMSAIRYAERTGEPFVVEDATQDDRFAHDPYLAALDCCALLAVPILNRGSLQALLLLENRLIRGAFSAEGLAGVMLITGQLAVAFNNALVYSSLERKVDERTAALNAANERLERLSVTDPLTGLANRRELEEVLNREWATALRRRRPVGLAMIDIDYFKRFNDHYGHPAGDDCLRRVAMVLRQHIRPTDLAARYGGEEFAIVMPGADAATAGQFAERLRRAVADLRWANVGAPEGIVTVSVGVSYAAAPTIRQRPEDLLGLADARLYGAKHAGRNRIATGGPVR